jgi:hypothetical protein
MDIDVIGTMYDMSDFDAPAALQGYHVNTSEDVPQWSEFKVSPVTPARLFMGVDAVHCYKFESKSQFEALRGEE